MRQERRALSDGGGRGLRISPPILAKTTPPVSETRVQKIAMEIVKCKNSNSYGRHWKRTQKTAGATR